MRAVVRVVTSRQKEEKEKDKDAKNANLVSGELFFFKITLLTFAVGPE